MSLPCECCEQPPCATPVLEFVTREASCTVCGYALPEHGDLEPGEECLRFATRKDQISDLIDRDSSGEGFISTYYVTVDQWIIREKYQTEIGGCEERIVSGEYHASFTTFSSTGGVPENDNVFTDDSTAGPDGIFVGESVYTDNLDAGNNTSSPTTEGDVFDTLSPDGTWNYSAVGDTRTFQLIEDVSAGDTIQTRTYAVTFSDPVTACEPELPEWPEWAGATTGQASRTASGDCGLTLTLEECKWRVKHAPSGTCYLKVWIKKTVTPAVGSPTETELTYEWTGTGNPCIADPTKPVDHEDNIIYGAENEESAPEENGVVTFEILKFACCPGYEPDITDSENPQPNGFPDPTWEAMPP